MNASRPIGKTKDQGWEVGVSRTLPVRPEKAWTLIMAALGIPRSVADAADQEPRLTFTTRDKTRVEIRSYAHGSLLRMRWQPPGWESSSTLQIRVRPAKTGTTISLHHERLTDGRQRAALRAHWTRLLEGLAGAPEPAIRAGRRTVG